MFQFEKLIVDYLLFPKESASKPKHFLRNIGFVCSLHLQTITNIMSQSNVEVVICGQHADVLKVIKHIAHFAKLKLLIDAEIESASPKQISTHARLHSFSTWHLCGKNVTVGALNSHMTNNLAPNKVSLEFFREWIISGLFETIFNNND